MTAAILPFVIVGSGSLCWMRNYRLLLFLLLAPAYYMIFHTERRYVIAIQYFLLIITATRLAALFAVLLAY